MPKAGRTWLRVLIGRVVQQQTHAPLSVILQTQRLHRLSPDVPVIQVSHDGYYPGMSPVDVGWDKRRYRHKKVLLLVRDPRDVVISLYFQDRYRRDNPVGKELSDRIYGESDSIRTVCEFYNSWAAARHVPRELLLVRYEDLQADTGRELRRVLDFLGMHNVPPQIVDEAVSFASFPNMKELEASGALETDGLRTRDLNNPDSFKVRRGKVGGYRDYVDEADVAYLDQFVARTLSDFFCSYR